MLGEVVCVIVLAFIPVDSNLFENFFVAKPMHVHVPCLGLFWLHTGIYKSISGVVVYLERGRSLFVTETDERGNNIDTFFSIAECTFGLSFSSLRNNIVNSLACGENWSVTLGGWDISFITRPITEIKISSIYTTGFWHDKIVSVRVNVEDHFACMVSDDCIRISFHVIKKPFSLCHSVFCWSCLNTRNLIECAKHSGVKVACII